MIQYRLISCVLIIFYSFCIAGFTIHNQPDVKRYENLLPRSLLKFARNLQHHVVDQHQQNLKIASKQLQKLTRSHNSFTKYPFSLTSFSPLKIFQLKNKKLSEMTSSLSRQLPIPDELPSLIQYGGDMLTYHVNSVMLHPDMLHGMAEKITEYMSGSQTIEENDNSKHALEMIHEAGLLGFEHQVVTPDGYILSIHRVISPKHVDKQRRPVVFLQHGLFCSSAVWLIGDRSKAFGFLLADAGFDVWLGNFRGNTYSRNHTFLDPEQDEFWQFSWDQMGAYDLPTMLQHVSHVTNTRVTQTSGSGDGIVYIGHSMGTTAFWVMCNEFPGLTENLVSLMVGMAPASVISRMSSPIRYIAPLSDQIERMMSLTGNSEFGTRENFLQAFPSVCATISNTTLEAAAKNNESMCTITDNIFFTMSGFDAAQMNYTLLPIILGHTPAGTSVKTVTQFAQGFNSKRFCHFDYGDTEKNYEMYGRSQPPHYDLGKVQVPVLLYWGQNDWITHPDDVQWLASQLPRLIASVRVPYDDWNHLDFMWAKDADSLLYNPIIDFIHNFMAF